MIRTPALRLVLSGILSASFTSCMLNKPSLLEINQEQLASERLQHYEKNLHHMYQSFWSPPLNDKDPMHVGILTQKKQVEFKTLQATKLLIYKNNKPYVVKSPKGTHWIIKRPRRVRPALVKYFPSVSIHVLHSKKTSTAQNAQLLSLWKKRGYPNAMWVKQGSFNAHPNAAQIKLSTAPPKQQTSPYKKKVLSLGQYTHKKAAQTVCIRARRRFKDSFCKVIARTDIPAIGKGVIQTHNQSFYSEFYGFIKVLSKNAKIKILQADVDTAVQKDANADQTYKGEFYILTNNQSKLDMIQRTTLHAYLTSVVPAEIFPDAHMEALKAQSVIARTYTLKHFEPLSGQAPYLICGDTRCQVYRGFTFTHSKTNKAIHATRSVFLTYNTQLAETFYHGMCGGHTEAKHHVWGPPAAPYLQGINDQIKPMMTQSLQNNTASLSHLQQSKPTAYCGVTRFSLNPVWNWKKTFAGAAVLKHLNLPLTHSPIKELKIVSRGVSGRVIDLAIVFENNRQQNLKGELVIRKTFGGLKSSLFTISTLAVGNQKHFEFTGRGFGHGVGMCQVGAIGRAENGQNYQTILNAYYPGTAVYTVK